MDCRQIRNLSFSFFPHHSLIFVSSPIGALLLQRIQTMTTPKIWACEGETTVLLLIAMATGAGGVGG